MNHKLILSACSFLMPEVAHVIKHGEYPDVQLMGFPASCAANSIKSHQLSEMASSSKFSASDIFLIGSVCHSSKKSSSENIREINLDHCFEIFINKETVKYYISQGYYLITNGWLRTTDQHIRDWGFDSKTAKIFFGESMKGILLLDTQISNDYIPDLEKVSAYMGLPYEILPIGLSHCEMFIDSLVFKWRNERGTITLNRVCQ